MKRPLFTMKYIKGLFCISLIVVMFPAVSFAQSDWNLIEDERRRTQFPNEEAHLIFPLPFSMPGIGTGVMVVGALANMYDSYTDLYLVGIIGDLEGYVFGLEDVHLIDETLVFDLTGQNFSSATVNQYYTRGMTSKKDEYFLAQVANIVSYNPRMRLMFDNRQIELYASAYTDSYRVDGTLTPDGDPLFPGDGETHTHNVYQWGMMLDYTDDRQDPRNGLRLSIMNSHTPRETSDEADFSVWDTSLSMYIPMGKQSTWAFNYMHSNADVRSQGEVDRNALAADPNIGGGCDLSVLSDVRCQSAVNNAEAANRYGTASALGGEQRLRAYPMGRFQGGAMAYFGTEFRWNLTDEFTPFNFGFWKDIRTSTQIAFYYERGTVAETQGALWELSREVFGVGLRMVSASGYTYRADIGSGDEGAEVTFMFNYPW